MIGVAFKNRFTARGEQVVHGYDEMSFPCEAYTWPNADQPPFPLHMLPFEERVG